MPSELTPGLRSSTSETMLPIAAIALQLVLVALVAASFRISDGALSVEVFSPAGRAFFASMIPLSITFLTILLATISGLGAIVLSRGVNSGDAAEVVDVRQKLSRFGVVLGAISTAWWFICCVESVLDSNLRANIAVTTILALIIFVMCAYIGSFAPWSLKLQIDVNQIELRRTQQLIRALARDDQLGVMRSIWTISCTLIAALLVPTATFRLVLALLNEHVPDRTYWIFVAVCGATTLLSMTAIMGATLLKFTVTRSARWGGWSLYFIGAFIFVAMGTAASEPGSAGSVWLWSLGSSFLVSAAVIAVSCRPGIRDHLAHGGKLTIDAALDGLIWRDLHRQAARLDRRRNQLAARARQRSQKHSAPLRSQLRSNAGPRRTTAHLR